MLGKVALLELMDGDVDADEFKARFLKVSSLEEPASFPEDEFAYLTDIATAFSDWDEFGWVDSS